MYMNAIVTTDGSAIAAAALPHVSKVVDPDGQVLVVEVVDSVTQVLIKTTPAGFDFALSDDGNMAVEIVKAQREEAARHLAEARTALIGAGLKNVETAVLEGLPGDEIVKAASERKAEVVVMSTHGRSGLRRAVLGSVADHVMRHLDNVAVLLVHPAAD